MLIELRIEHELPRAGGGAYRRGRPKRTNRIYAEVHTSVPDVPFRLTYEAGSSDDEPPEIHWLLLATHRDTSLRKWINDPTPWSLASQARFYFPKDTQGIYYKITGELGAIPAGRIFLIN